MTTHISEGTPVYQPDLSRDPIEIARRESNPRGSVILEEQESALEIALRVAQHDFAYQNERDFAYGHIAEELANAAWHLYGKSDDVQRRRQLLPIHADDSADFRETRPGLTHHIRSGLAYAAEAGHRLVIAHHRGLETTKQRVQLGRGLGNIAIACETLQLTNAPQGMSEFDIQKIVRLYGIDLFQRARTRYHDVGVAPSIAQLSRPTTPVSLEWQRTAPATNESYELLAQAQRDFGLAA